MGKKLLLLVTLFILVPTVAASFTLQLEPINDRISLDDEASFRLTINNQANQFDDYEISFKDVGRWDNYYTEPLSDYLSGINNVGARQSRTTKIVLKPILGIGVGFHEVKIDVISKSSGTIQTTTLPIYVQSSSKDLDFLPHVQVGISVPEKIDPREKNELEIVLENRNRKVITGAEIIVTSSLIELNQVVDLQPLERKEFTFPLEFDPYQAPQQDRLKVKVKVAKYTFEPDPINYEIIDYSGEYSIEDNVKKSFLLMTNDRTYLNDGNRRQAQLVLEQTSLLADIFKSSTPKPDKIVNKDGKRFRAWELQLQPGETTTIKLVSNYRIILYILLIGLVLYCLYRMFKSPIELKKHAKNIEMREGGISEVKIMLNIKNISNKTLDQIELHDSIPNIANITNEFDVGTVRPHRIMKHEGRGSTRVEWKLDELDPHEDRVITYRIKSKLPILGQFNLPPAEVKFQHKKGGKRVKVSSNRLRVGQ